MCHHGYKGRGQFFKSSGKGFNAQDNTCKTKIIGDHLPCANFLFIGQLYFTTL